VTYAAAQGLFLMRLTTVLIPSLTLMNGHVFFTRYDLCVRKKEEKNFQVADYCVTSPFLDMMTDFLVTGS
jgi:hypothetical protein